MFFAEVIEEVTYTNNIDIITRTPKLGQEHNFVYLINIPLWEKEHSGINIFLEQFYVMIPEVNL